MACSRLLFIHSRTVQTVKGPVSSAAAKRRQWQLAGWRPLGRGAAGLGWRALGRQCGLAGGLGLAGPGARCGWLERSGAVAQLEERVVVCLCGTSQCDRQLGAGTVQALLLGPAGSFL